MLLLRDAVNRSFDRGIDDFEKKNLCGDNSEKQMLENTHMQEDRHDDQDGHAGPDLANGRIIGEGVFATCVLMPERIEQTPESSLLVDSCVHLRDFTVETKPCSGALLSYLRMKSLPSRE